VIAGRLSGHDEASSAAGARAGVGAGSETGWAARGAVALIGIYQRFVSPALPRACRFHPTCSIYAREAVTRYGLLRGTGMSLLRLSKCHPFHKGGFDPVK